MNSETNKILEEIKKKSAKIGGTLRFMGLCGTHAQTIARDGIKNLLPENVKLVSGPGCPVCVTDQEDIDVIAELTLSGIPIATYGDVINVPGNRMSIEEARRQNAKVFAIYDVADALKLKKKYPDLVFFGLGFETTAPMTAWAIKNGLVVYSVHKIFPPAMKALLHNKNIKIDGFINPGHVSAIIGTEVYKKFKIPQVIAGFEGVDVLKAVDMLLDQILNKEIKVENEYERVVKDAGNVNALKLIEEIFEVKDSKWRGIGIIKKSGLKIKKKYQKQDAEFIYKKLITKIKREIKLKTNARLIGGQSCLCGLVLQGLIESKECPLFGKVCAPDNPQGACMVSVEGACNIEYRYSSK